MFNQAINRHSMSQSLDITAAAPLLPNQISQDGEPLTKEMMLEWKTPNVGFEKLLASNAGRRLFDNFLRKEFSSENLHFWIACEKLKSITEEKKFNDHVDVIFKIYIDPSALNEVLMICHYVVNEQVLRSAWRAGWCRVYVIRGSVPRETSLRRHRPRFSPSCIEILSRGLFRETIKLLVCFRFLISKDYKDALLQFGPITPESPSTDPEEPKYPQATEGELSNDGNETNALLKNVQALQIEIENHEGESLDPGLQQGEVEKSMNGREEEIEKSDVDVAT